MPGPFFMVREMRTGQTPARRMKPPDSNGLLFFHHPLQIFNVDLGIALVVVQPPPRHGQVF